MSASPSTAAAVPGAGIPEPVAGGHAAPPAMRSSAPVPDPMHDSAARPFEPLLLVFTCNWCSYRAADLAGTARMKYPPNVRLIRFMCAGRLDPAFVLKAFAEGADGVIVTGCWPADCHYRIQNVKALRRFLLLRRVIANLGIEPERLQLVYASAAEGQRLASEFTRIVEDVRALGPLGWRDPPGPRPICAPAGAPATEASPELDAGADGPDDPGAADAAGGPSAAGSPTQVAEVTA